jgi:FemAB-related protein (PEP-CTERM system-associated)
MRRSGSVSGRRLFPSERAVLIQRASILSIDCAPEQPVLISPVVGETEWDRFVHEHPDSTGYHVWKWRTVFERAFGHRTEYLAATQGSDIVGVLPLVVFESRLFGRFMVSLPFVNYGGVLSSSEDARRALLRHAFQLARELRLSHIELRHTARLFPDLPAKHHKVSMHLKLAPDSDSAWKALKNKERNLIRKAQKSDLDVRIGGVEHIDEFYRIFARNMRDLGTPVYGRGFFESIFDAFPEQTRIFLVEFGGRAIAASITYAYRGHIEVPWASSLREFRDRCPNNLLYWTMIQYAIENRFEIFDFGRSSPDDGPFRFKQQLGAEPVPLHWEYGLFDGQGLPDQSPRNPKFRLAVNAWKRMPLGLATCVGPHIVRCIP